MKKLCAVDVTEKNDVHPMFAIYHNDEIVAITGLRRSSKKDILVPHIKNDLRVNAAFILDLARCPKSREDWLRKIGILTSADPT